MRKKQIIRKILIKQFIMELTVIYDYSFLISSVLMSYPFYKLPILILEMNIIKPKKESLEAYIDFYKKNKFLGYNSKMFDKFVSLTRFQSGLDKVYCDWCGLINGINEMILYSIKDYIRSKKDIDKLLKKLYIPNYAIYTMRTMSIYCSPIQFFKKEIQTEINIIHKLISDNYKVRLDENKIEKIKLFIEWLYFGEYIERTWCPFKHMKNIKYKRNYYYYNSHNIENLKLASHILIKEGKITCNNCIKILNKESRLRTDEESLFKEYASYIKKL